MALAIERGEPLMMLPSREMAVDAMEACLKAISSKYATDKVVAHVFERAASNLQLQKRNQPSLEGELSLVNSLYDVLRTMRRFDLGKQEENEPFDQAKQAERCRKHEEIRRFRFCIGMIVASF